MQMLFKMLYTMLSSPQLCDMKICIFFRENIMYKIIHLRMKSIFIFMNSLCIFPVDF